MPTTNDRVLRRANRAGQAIENNTPANDTCPHCNHPFSDEARRAITVQHVNNYRLTMQVCEACVDEHYTICEDCELLVYEDHLRTTEDDRSVCQACQYDNYATCSNCSAFVSSEETYDGYCNECSDQNGLIKFRNYQDKPDLFQSKNTGPILKSTRIFGVELETQYGKQEYAVKVSRDLIREVGITGDGSIQGLGLEIITPPASGDLGEKMIEDVCKALITNKAKVDKSCGMHIHLDVNDIDEGDPYSQFNRAKYIWLTYITFEDVIRSFISPSRRENKYCANLAGDYHLKEIADSKNMDEMEQIWYRVKNKKDLNAQKSERKHGSRYRGINMHTLFSERHIEIRYHTGTIIARKVLEWANLHCKLIDLAINYVQRVEPRFFLEWMNLDLNKKTDKLFSLLKLEPSSEAYFRARQEQFATKPTKIEGTHDKEAKDVLSAEQEA